MNQLALDIEKVTKRFGAVRALRGVSMTVERGTVHALIGENGAGKSTLMKILAGVYGADSGHMVLDGSPYAPHSPRHARALGVCMVYQELTLAAHLTVEENVCLGAERSRFGILQSRGDRVSQALAMLGHGHIDIHAPVAKLGIGEQQIVEIARSLVLDSKLVIMDEPTSSLSARDGQALFKVIRRLRERGITVVYISHFLEEIREIADNYTVLRDGAAVAEGAVAKAGLDTFVTAMVGRSVEQMFPRPPHRIGALLLSATNIVSPPRVKNASLEVRAGEILGIAGLVGAGRTETLRVMFGLDRARDGVLTVGAQSRALAEGYSACDALGLGLSMISENRKDEGLAVDLSIRENVTLASLGRFVRKVGVLNTRKEKSAAAVQAAETGIKCASVDDPCRLLSGGNQQKVALARILFNRSTVFLLDEPTRGIDVRSKVEIYRLIGELAAAGKAVIMVSSYLPELFGICDTLAVMHRGVLSDKRAVEQWSEERVMAFATTGKEEYTAVGTR